MELELKLPSPDSPGFLLRTREALKLQKLLDKDQISEEAIDKLIEFLLPYVVKPEGKDKAKEALLNASQNQFTEMFSAITGSSTIAPQA